MRKGSIWKYLIFGIFAINICYILISQQTKMNKIQAEVKDKTVEAQKLKTEKQKLQDEIKMSQSDAYSEKLAREKLGLVKEGEVSVINQSNKK